jgi:Glycosyl hydrolase catalytic core
MKKLALPGLFVSLTILNACGGGTTAIVTPPPPPPVINAAVTVSTTKVASFDVAMSTSFQPAEWDYRFFQTSLNAKTTLLGNLQPHHIRLQGISQGVPEGAAGTGSTTWSFAVLDGITQPVLGVGDQSPEFQIAKAPPFMYVNNDSSNSFNDPGFSQFKAYATKLVQYYNTGGFTDSSGTHQVSPAYPNDKITWWGIYNEPSINNNLSATDYVNMYNTLVPVMHSADTSLKFVAMELCCSSESWVQIFAANLNANVPVDAVATHYYSTCNQQDTDVTLFATVPTFASSIQTIQGYLAASASLANVPVWITENNVNADFDKGNGISACNGTTFVTDKRGTSAFFAAWRPYVFSQVGKVGARALYHWDFDADAQYGEVDFSTGQTQLSYWVDYWLAQILPSGTGQQSLQFTNSDDADVEVLPVINTDGSVVIMISNHAVASATDNNGAGLTAKVSVDVSSLGSFTSASEVMIDASTSPTTGPVATSVSAQSPITVNFSGYGVAFLKLQ